MDRWSSTAWRVQAWSRHWEHLQRSLTSSLNLPRDAGT